MEAVPASEKTGGGRGGKIVIGSTLFVPSQNKIINKEQRLQLEKTSAPNLISSVNVVKNTNYSVAHCEEGSARQDNSSCVAQECDHDHTATADYQVMHGIPLLRGSEVADEHSHSQSHTHSFQNLSEDRSHYCKDEDSNADVKEAIGEATQLYHALAYSLMITVLSRLKITPHTYSKYSTAVYFGLGVAHFKISEYDSATSNFLKAQKVAEGNNDIGTCALIEYYLAEIEYAQNKFLTSAGYYEQAITHHQTHTIGRMFEIDLPSLSVLYCRRGTTLRYGSKVMEAVKMYREAVHCAVSREDELTAHTNLGNLYQAIGDFARAVEEYTKTIELGEKNEDYVSLGWAHGNIGNAYLGLSKRDKALEHLDKALKLTLQHEPSPLAIGRALNNLGTAYQAIGNNEKAKEFYDQSLSQAVYGSDLPGQARVYGNLGNILMVQEKYLEAIAHYTETLTISRDRATQTTAYHNRGCARYERAETERKAHLEKEGANSGKSSLMFQGSNVWKHEVDHRQVKLQDQIHRHYRSAQSDLEKVMKYHEQTLNNIKGSATGLNLSVSLFETNSRTFQRLQDCSFCTGNWKQALVFAEQSRARTLGELLLKKKKDKLDSDYRTPLDLPQIVNIIKHLKLPVLYMSFTGVRLLVWLLLATDNDPSSDLSINMFQVYIPPDYFEDKSFDHVVRYQLTEKLCDMINMYEACQYSSDTLLNRLYELIAPPLLRLLEAALPRDMAQNEIILIPDSYTRLLPMSALQDTKTRKFLGDQIRFHIMNSLLTTGILYQLPKATVSIPLDSKNTCIIGNPSTPPFHWKGEPWRLGRLPHSEDEAKRVAFTLATTPIVGHEASKEVVNSKIKHSKIIHLATHGCASGGFLVFSGSSKDVHHNDPQSLLLFTEEIEKLTTPAALVVLSSCDSGRGMFKADGIQGIARSFLLAGAHTVLTSLWRVPDESACYFMHFFYRYLVDGFPSYSALQKACLSIRCYKKYGGYIHWSGYQLQGREISIVNTAGDNNGFLHVLGPTSSFPDLERILSLAENLIHTPNTAKSLQAKRQASVISQKTEVQLLVGSPATNPMEVVIDYIASEWSHYTGGIFWFSGLCSDLVTASLVHVNELCSVLPKPSDVHESLTLLADYFSKLDDPILLVLHHFLDLPLDVSPLRKLMQNKHVSIIVTAPVSIKTQSIVSIAHKELSRGCVPISLMPLPFNQMMQRTVYHILSQYEFHPMNQDQEILDDIEDFLCGNSVVSKLCFSTLDYFIEQREQDVGKGLETFSNEVIEPTRDKSKRMTEYRPKDMDATGKGRDDDGDEAFTPREEEALDEGGSVQVTEGLINDTAKVQKKTFRSWEELEEMPNPVVLVFACQLISCLPLSSLERVLMNCLSVLNCAPFHGSVLCSLEANIRGYVTPEEVTTEDLSNILTKYSIIVPCPPPVVKFPTGSSSRATLSIKDSSPTYYLMPEAITEAVFLSLREIDRVVACAILNRTLNELQSRRYGAAMEGVTQSEDVHYFDIISLHVVGLKGLLLSYLVDEWNMFTVDTVEGMIKQYIADKIDMVGDYGVLELVSNLINMNNKINSNV